MLADGAVAMVVLIVVYLLRYHVDVNSPPPVSDVWAPVLLYGVTWVLLLYLVGEYRLRARWTLRSEIIEIAKATIWLSLLSIAALFLSDLTFISRVFLLILFPIQWAVTVGMRALLRWAFIELRKRGRNPRNVVVIGTGPEAVDFARRIEQHTTFGLRVVGFLGEPTATSLAPWSCLGPVSAILKVMHERVVDEVAVCVPRSDWSEIEEIIGVCQEEGKILRIPLEAPQVETGMRIIEDVDGVAVLSLVQGPDRLLSLAAKRMLDVTASAVLLVLLSPLILGVAVYIRLKDGSPVLFRQTRVGMHGRPFTIYKFRTMVADAEDRYDEVVSLSDTNGAAFKMEHDPRITGWGHKLRRTSVDELPQLWNVLRGSMSLVGPRPAPPREVDGYDVWHRRRLSMKPGLTGLWQVSSRLDHDFDDRAKLDIDYIDRWSFWLDLRIVARTFPAVLHLEGR
jgi:exopolysaccharide biosynthesis polyprenyl glycosylphosphotransferase